MRWFGENWQRESVAAFLHQRAQLSTYNGEMTPKNKVYTDACTAAYVPDGVIIIFTRDVGHHSSGWWKNPDYERCYHLSLSFRDPVTGALRPRDKKASALWVEAFFPATKNLVWAEPPYSEEGKRCEVWHYRVFYAENWVAPILPRGEVYSKANTPAHWKS